MRITKLKLPTCSKWLNKMKLTRENIYINLQGKSKEELTELEQITGLFNLHQWNYKR